VCSDTGLQKLLKIGFTINYHYRGSDGGFIIEIPIRLSDCGCDLQNTAPSSEPSRLPTPGARVDNSDNSKQGDKGKMTDQDFQTFMKYGPSALARAHDPILDWYIHALALYSFAASGIVILPLKDWQIQYRSSLVMDIDVKITELEDNLKTNPKDYSIYWDLAIRYLFLQKYDRAMRCINTAINISPSTQELYYCRALVHIKMGNSSKAKEDLEMASSSPNSESAKMGQEMLRAQGTAW
jgi:tetratricopeptide (TPR) repeat protein